MVFPRARRWISNRLAFCFLVANPILCACQDDLHAMTNDLAAAAPDPPITIRTSVGYKDNISLRHVYARGSPFVRDGLDVDLVRDFSADSRILFFVTGDDYL